MACGCGKKPQPVQDDLSIIMKRGKIIVGVKTDSMPFGFYDNNHNLKGYDIELATYIAKALLGDSHKIEFMPVTSSNRITKLENNEVDMLVSTMSVTPERTMLVDFSKPYFISGQAILVDRNSKIKGLKSLEKKRIIVVFGTTSEENIQKMIPSATVYGYRTYPLAFNAFESGKADAILADDTVLLGYAMNNSSVKVLSSRYSVEPYAVAFRKGWASQRLESKVNIIIDNMQSTGKLNKMRHKWNLR